MQNNFLTPHDRKNVLTTLATKARQNERYKRLVLEIRAINGIQFTEPPQADRLFNLVDFPRIDFEVSRQDLYCLLGHPTTYLQAHDIQESALPHRFLDSLKQVIAFQFLHRYFGIPRDPKRMRLHDFQPGKEQAQVRSNDLLQPHKCEFRESGCPLAGWRFQADQLRQSIGHLDPSKVFHTLLVSDHHRKVQTAVRDVRERPTRIKGQGRQDREYILHEVRGHGGLLLPEQTRVVHDSDPLELKGGQKLAIQQIVRSSGEFTNPLPNELQLDGNRSAVNPCLRSAARQLLDQPGHPHHEELVKVRAENRQKFNPFEQRIGRILCLLQHSCLKFQQTQLTIEVEPRIIQIGRSNIRAGEIGLR